MSRTIKIDELEGAIERDLSLYAEHIIEGIKIQTKASMKELVKDTKATAPVGKREKHYKDSITSKKIVDTPNHISYLWYVKKPDYRLSHLLEYGHATRNGGRTRAFHFIENAAEPILEHYEKMVEEIIKNG